MEIKKNKQKIFNDPLYGFIRVPNNLIFDIIEHRFFQRLRRITQMGFSYMVYTGAHHTRFQHALGCMHIMGEAIRTLRIKGVKISAKEEEAVMIAILLHDIGHGPFSHALEHTIVKGTHHEELSLLLMHKLNKEFNGQLSLAIKIFKGNYHRKFFKQLISGQLDMDRMDYLKRDSFYTGVAEGNINSERLIKMLMVYEDRLVVEEKGIYSVEQFLNARRLMYWQVYLHKTGVVAEYLLVNFLKRLREVNLINSIDNISKPLKHFLLKELSDFSNVDLENFVLLDDFDIMNAIKTCINHEDEVLSLLSKMILDRRLLKVEVYNNKLSKKEIKEKKNNLISLGKISYKNWEYFCFTGKLKNQAYNVNKETIEILYKDNTVKKITESSDHLKSISFRKSITKYFFCYPK